MWIHILHPIIINLDRSLTWVNSLWIIHTLIMLMQTFFCVFKSFVPFHSTYFTYWNSNHLYDFAYGFEIHLQDASWPPHGTTPRVPFTGYAVFSASQCAAWHPLELYNVDVLDLPTIHMPTFQSFPTVWLFTIHIQDFHSSEAIKIVTNNFLNHYSFIPSSLNK